MVNNPEIKKILLVDDEEDIRDVLAITLQDLGYEVTLAENGQRAMELFETHGFPIVLTDIKMPVMDGIQLLKKIKTMAPETEIIMITGHGDMDLAIESFRNQAVEFITKPVDVTTLAVAIDRAKEKIVVKRQLFDYTHNLERLVQKKSEALKAVHRESTSDLAAIMETLPMVVFCIDRQLKITSSNASFKALFDKTPFNGNVQGFCHKICRDSAVPCEGCPALESFMSGKPAQAEVTYRTAKQAEVSFLAWASPVEQNPPPGQASLPDTPDQPVNEVMIMATDISQVVDIEDHLKSLGLMIGSVSHGIKGLLTGLDGGLYLLDSALKKENQHLAQEGLETMKLMTSKIRKLILDILFYTKKRELKKERLTAGRFAEEIIQTVKQRMDRAGIELEQHLPAPEIEFMADSTPLQAALVNILDNAIDACQAKQAADPADPPQHQRISLGITQNNDQIEFTIKDTGIGMTDTEIEKAFTLFHSGKEKKGTGLGLFIADKVVSQHQGTIQVASTPNQGTTFSIRLPIGID